MNISYNWLKSLIDFDLDPHELAERLTMSGHEVEEMSYLGEGLEGIVVGRAAGIRPHPDADKLKLVEVDCGRGENVEVVCGAPNVKQGGLYPLALQETTLPGGFKIKKTKIRGVESCGMLCSEAELGLSDDAAGLMELDSGHEPGTPLAAAISRDDWLLVLEITANRGDMWSHLGAARELQPFAGKNLTLPPSDCEERGMEIESLTSVKIEDPVGCPRYMARVILDVKVGPSPRWLVERLEAVGQRSINNIVDVTNYVLFELGQPLHAFDMDKLEEKRIVVRKARKGETILTLDEIARRLTTKMTVIADAQKPVAVAGVMGDKFTEVDENTACVLLECAYFDPVTNRRTGRALGLFSEASRRFERGTDYGLMPYAVDRAARLIAEVSSGTVAKGVIDIYPSPIQDKVVELRPSRVKRMLGVEFDESEIRKWLEGIDFRVAKKEGGVLEVQVPTCRTLDVSGEEDLIEELARLRGYDRIPVPSRMDITPEAGGRENYNREMNLRHVLSGMGFQEVMTTSFADSQFIEKIYGPGRFAPMKLESPISSDEDVLRPSLFSTLLACVKRNINQRNMDLRLFEIGNVFTRKPGEKGTGEQKHLGIAATGGECPVHWSGSPRQFDFFALKGVLESLFSRLKLPAPVITEDSEPVLHPGEAADVFHKNEKVGFLGRLNPSLARECDLPEDIFFLELYLEPLLSSISTPVYRETSPFPGVRRDLSILVGETTTCAELIEEIRQGSALVTDVKVFDLYQGEHVPKGKRSLAMSVLFQSRDRTLRDEEVDRIFNGLFQKLVKKFGIQPR